MATITYEKLSQKLTLHQVTIPQIQYALAHEQDVLHDIGFFPPRVVDAEQMAQHLARMAAAETRHQQAVSNIAVLQRVLAEAGATSIYAQQCSDCGTWGDELLTSAQGLLCPACYEQQTA